MEEIKIIVKENFSRHIFPLGEENEIISTVGVKIRQNGEYLGNYIGFEKPKLDVADVVEAANKLLCELLSNSDHQQEGEENEQSEGEWIVEESPLLLDKKISCSCCGYSERRGPAWNISWGVYNFCPNCGAKMKGGADNGQ